MWYEQLWSGAVTMGFIAGALYFSGVTNYLDTGRLYRRHTSNHPRLVYSIFLLLKCLNYSKSSLKRFKISVEQAYFNVEALKLL